MDHPPTVRQWSERPFEAFTVDGLFDAGELAVFRSSVDSALSEPGGCAPFTSQEFLNGKRVAPELSSAFYDRLRPLLPSTYVDAEGASWTFAGAVHKVMFARVEPGQSFGIHTDTGCEYDTGRNRYSKFTVLTYLNDDFEGGGTTFYDSGDFAETFRVPPVAGRTLAFDLGLFHAGEQVESGGPKAWLGTELVCSRVKIKI
jgi:hypothetical protein